MRKPAPAAKPSWYRRLYAKVESFASTPYALWAMLIVSVIDGMVFPVPPFAILVPMVVAQPKRWWRLALLGTLASVLGGFFGWQIGHFGHDLVLRFFHIDLNASVDNLWAFRKVGLHGTLGGLLGKNLWMVIVICTLFPLFKVVSIGSGAVAVPIVRFLIAALIGRSIRFFFVAAATAIAAVRAKKIAARANAIGSEVET